jgi:hypothetical protein
VRLEKGNKNYSAHQYIGNETKRRKKKKEVSKAHVSNRLRLLTTAVHISKIIYNNKKERKELERRYRVTKNAYIGLKELLEELYTEDEMKVFKSTLRNMKIKSIINYMIDITITK